MYVYTLPGIDKAQVIEALENEADRLRRMAARPHTNSIAADMYNQLAGTLEQIGQELAQTLAIVLVSNRADQVSLFGDTPKLVPLEGEALRENVKKVLGVDAYNHIVSQHHLRCSVCHDVSVLFGPVGHGETHEGCGGVYRLERAKRNA